MKLIAKTPSQTGELVLEDKPLGRGGEGSVYSVTSHTINGILPAKELVAKLYHEKNDKKRGKKIGTMVVNPPDSENIAWPLALVADEQGQFLGYLMKKLPPENFRLWAQIAHAQERKKLAGSFDVRYALTASLNLAYAFEEIHDVNSCVGDINESNALISTDATVFVIDTDSAQIVRSDGEIFKCEVGKPEFTAPELTHGSFRDHVRTVESDMFGYAVLVYQMMTGGAHPTDGVFQGEGDPPNITNKIREGVLPNLRKEKQYKPVARVPAAALPNQLKELLIKAYSVDPNKRPAFEDFDSCLNDVLDNLVQCKKVKTHWYDKRDKKCGWCVHADTGQMDPWNLAPPKPPKQKSSQRALPSINFKKEEGPKKAPRAPVGGANGVSPVTNVNQPSNMPNRNYNVAPSAVPTISSNGLTPLSQIYQSNSIVMPKRKGKTLLTFADGSQRPRPPLAQVAAQQPKVAWQCFVNEFPENMKITWGMRDKLPNKNGLFVGLVVGLLVAGLWWLMIPQAANIPQLRSLPYADSWLVTFLKYLQYASLLTGVCGILAKFILTFREYTKVRKIAGDRINYIMHESIATTILKMFIFSLLYGPFFVLIALGILITMLIGFMSEGSKQR